MALKMKAKPAAAGPKLAKQGKASKPAASAAKGKPAPGFKEGQVVEFVGYTGEQENPLFTAGERLTIVSKEKGEDGKTVYAVVRESDHEQYTQDPESVDGDQVLAEEIKKAEKPVVDPFAITVVNVGKLEDVLHEHEDDPLKAAQAMQEEAAENLFYLGGFIAQLYANQKFRDYGDYQDDVVDDKPKYGTGWDRFCHDNLNMNGRAALSHLNIYQKFSTIQGLDWSAISRNKKIGWVKLDAMAKVVSKDNVQELLEAAAEKNVEEFKATIREEYVAADGGARNTAPKVRRLTVKYQLFEDQAEGVKYVLEQAKKTLGIEDDNQVFEAIVMMWGAANLSDTAFTKARAAKRKVQSALSKQGVDVAKLREQDAKLEEFLTVDDGDEGGEAEGAEAEAETAEA